MNVLSLLKTQFVDILQSMADGKILPAVFSESSTVVKYLVPVGYPEKPVSDAEIAVNEKRIWDSGAKYYYSSVYERDGRTFTTHSRAVAVVGASDSLSNAEEKAEDACGCVSGPLWHRKDIGTRALVQKRVEHMQRLRP
ncbi:MAG: phosphoribosylglycinamide synthetase C domain-containing protein [Candidatus ainarchaeum sp.]|nr:phosphoribosylglycinamide synthetase C domain-containing protein [Candidatus ainarchaeum sp.]